MMPSPSNSPYDTVMRPTALLAASMAQADDWPQWRGPNRDAVWNETGILQTFPAEGLKIRWRAPMGGGTLQSRRGRGPRLCHGLRMEKPKCWERVHCFDEKTGKRLWTFSDEVK